MKELKRELIIPNSQNNLAEADDFIESNLETLGVDKSLIADIAISATELINNAILHGNGGDTSKQVKIRLEVENKTVIVEIVDQGKGFDPTIIPDPLAEENLLKEVGRGIFIARSLVDELRFDREPGWGTKASITKYLPG
ncbi:MAG: ATP-binding protein [candidate division Zixibacteria bacterium]|nr:ATP-binding protein [candidate division Zixibacteria bacterium]